MDSTNPGLVNVANQTFDGLPNPDQAVTVQTPSTAPLANFRGEVSRSAPVSVDQPVNVQVPGEPTLTLNGDNFKPGGVATDTSQNNVASQVYGTGTPRNVFV